MRKAQTEILGLAIVVILLVVGMTFVIRFMLEQEPIDFKEQFTQSQLSSNTVNTFLGTTSRDCDGLNMKELIQDCSQGQTISCKDGSEDVKGSCTYVKDSAEEIFADTLESWNVKYHFTLFKKGENPFIELGAVCTGSKTSDNFIIPTSSGSVTAKMDICG